MDDVAVGLEHVDLLDGLDGLGVELLQVGLELLVIVVGAGGRALNRSSGSSLSTARRNTSVDQFRHRTNGDAQATSRISNCGGNFPSNMLYEEGLVGEGGWWCLDGNWRRRNIPCAERRAVR